MRKENKERTNIFYCIYFFYHSFVLSPYKNINVSLIFIVPSPLIIFQAFVHNLLISNQLSGLLISFFLPMFSSSLNKIIFYVFIQHSILPFSRAFYLGCFFLSPKSLILILLCQCLGKKAQLIKHKFCSNYYYNDFSSLYFKAALK